MTVYDAIRGMGIMSNKARYLFDPFPLLLQTLCSRRCILVHGIAVTSERIDFDNKVLTDNKELRIRSVLKTCPLPRVEVGDYQVLTVLTARPQGLDAAAMEKGYYPLLLSPVAKVVRVLIAGRLLSETFLLKYLHAGSRRTGCYLSAKAAC